VDPRELALREVRESPWLQQRELAARLAAETGLAESTLIRLFRRMEAEGELRSGLDGRRTTYALPEPADPEPAPPEPAPPEPAPPEPGPVAQPSAGALWSGRLAPLGAPEHEPADDEGQSEPATRRVTARWPMAALVAGVLAASVLAAVLLSPTKRDPYTGQPENEDSQPLKQEPKAAAKPKVRVAVLSGVTAQGAAVKEAKRLKAKGFRIGAVTDAPGPASRSAVLYARGERDAAQAVAEAAGIRSVKAVDSATSAAARGAKLSVVVGSRR
jgi:hypothetical protein